MLVVSSIKADSERSLKEALEKANADRQKQIESLKYLNDGLRQNCYMRRL